MVHTLLCEQQVFQNETNAAFLLPCDIWPIAKNNISPFLSAYCSGFWDMLIWWLFHCFQNSQYRLYWKDRINIYLKQGAECLKAPPLALCHLYFSYSQGKKYLVRSGQSNHLLAFQSPFQKFTMAFVQIFLLIRMSRDCSEIQKSSWGFLNSWTITSFSKGTEETDTDGRGTDKDYLLASVPPSSSLPSPSPSLSPSYH